MDVKKGEQSIGGVGYSFGGCEEKKEKTCCKEVLLKGISILKCSAKHFVSIILLIIFL